jgi:gliding motility-associated-like protein
VEVFANENQREYIDEEVECFTEYCYSVVFINQNGAQSYSDTVCMEGIKIYFPPPVRNTTVSVNDNQIEMDWTPPELQLIQSYFIQKRIEDNVYATLDTVTVNQYVDLTADVDSEINCYRISYLDECSNRSNLGILSCSVYLTLEENRVLEWNDYLGWQNGVKHYIIEVYQENGTLEEEINMGTSNTYEIQDYIRQQIVNYRIRVESNDDPPLISYSNIVTKEIESVLWIPNAFTPNGDGLNDFFKPEGTLMQQFNMKIFNRAGNLLFETGDQESGWDGLYNGKEMPFNTYIYDIEAIDNRGKSFNQTGKVLLMRE